MTCLPFQLSIVEPCEQSWSTMTGTSMERHCTSCNKYVHDLAALTPRQIERLIHASNGHLCARITRREDGSLRTARRRLQRTPSTSAFLLASALASGTGFAVAQTPEVAVARVTGTVLPPKNKDFTRAEVLFVQGEKTALSTTTDMHGRFSAEVPPGTYDVIFRNGMLFGERVIAVDLHAGDQSFAPIQERFAYGHLGELNQSSGDTVLVGEVVSVITGMSFHYAVRHPLSYLGMMKRRIARAWSS